MPRTRDGRRLILGYPIYTERPPLARVAVPHFTRPALPTDTRLAPDPHPLLEAAWFEWWLSVDLVEDAEARLGLSGAGDVAEAREAVAAARRRERAAARRLARTGRKRRA